MKRITMITAVVILSMSTFGGAAETRDPVSKWKGWLSDKGCAKSKVESDNITPNGTACVKKCLDAGETPVFVSPDAKAMFEVKDYPSLKDDVGYYLELTGVLDEKTKTIAVKSVTRGKEIVNICALPSKKK